MSPIIEGEVEISMEIQTEIMKVLKNEINSNVIEMIIRKGTKKGDNYTGSVYSVKGTSNEIKSKEIRLVLKILPPNEIHHIQFKMSFNREIKMYTELFPMFYAFQESCGVNPEQNGFFEYPKCYKFNNAEDNKFLILLDLRENGFEMFNRLDELTFDHVNLVMDTLGKFHGISFALRDQNPDKLKLYSNLPEICMHSSDRMKNFVDQFLEGCFDALSNDEDAELLKKIKNKFKGKYVEEMLDCVNFEAAEPYSVICHGDCWNNNMLYKNDKDGIPIEIRFLDFQMSRFASPVTDIVYYLFCCTSKKLRDQHYDNIINVYYRSVSKMIKKLGSNPDELFPYGALKAQLKRFGKFGLLYAMMLLNVTTASIETIDVNANVNDQLKHLFATPTEIYKERMRDVAIDIDRLGYI